MRVWEKLKDDIDLWTISILYNFFKGIEKKKVIEYFDNFLYFFIKVALKLFKNNLLINGLRVLVNWILQILQYKSYKMVWQWM